LMMSLWDALRMNMMISYQELVRTFPRFKFTTESLEMELLEYLELRNELFNDIEEVMGSYAQRAP
ncbi:hypothetical protein PO433_27385, partial [Escherichia coli]